MFNLLWRMFCIAGLCVMFILNMIVSAIGTVLVFIIGIPVLAVTALYYAFKKDKPYEEEE